MKARIKATGEIVDINPTLIDSYDFVDNKGIYYTIEQLELIRESVKPIKKINDPDYWTRLEHQAAIAAMQAQMAPDCLDSPEGVACTAYAYAHALVKKYKEKEERK